MGDDSATVYALDATSGRLLWRQKLDAHPMARITAAPVFRAGRLYVPISSLEEAPASAPGYAVLHLPRRRGGAGCRHGAVLWNTPVIAAGAAAIPQEQRRHAAVWSGGRGGVELADHRCAPRAAVRRHGQFRTRTLPAPTANSVVAIGLASGKLRWVRQLTRNDNWVIDCAAPVISPCPPGETCKGPGMANCPTTVGPDADFGNSPILRRLADGRELLSSARNPGWCMRSIPDRDGATVWVARAGQGSSLGGIEWGMAADATTVYAPISNVYGFGGQAPGGITALDIATGRVRWSAPPIRAACSFGVRGCTGAQSQAATLIPGAVFSGAQDGHLRAYAADSGRVIWDFDTAREFSSVNGVPAIGGSLDHGGAVVVDGVVYVLSGYGRINGQPGNLLLALSVDGK